MVNTLYEIKLVSDYPTLIYGGYAFLCWVVVQWGMLFC